MGDTARSFVRESVRQIRDVYLPRLGSALEALPAGDLWWRPHGGALAFGTILRHLEGNVRQWILCGIGGAGDFRDRADEFSKLEGDGPALLRDLTATVAEACEVIESLEDRGLGTIRAIQGQRTSGLAAVYHVVEHFSWHTAQAVWIAKARAGVGHGISFHDDAELDAARNG